MLALKLKHLAIGSCIGLVLFVILTIGSAGSVLADTGTGTTTITGGSLSETLTVPTVDNATLNGTDKNLTITMPITVIDATGSGSGWNVTITSTTFSTDRKSTRLNSSHGYISYAVFCLKKKKNRK